MTTSTPASEGADQLGLPWDLTEWVSAKDLLRWIDEDVATLDWNNPNLVAFLQAHRCGEAQGNYFSPPLAPERFVSLLDAGLPGLAPR